jgi:hypothetical protein
MHDCQRFREDWIAGSIAEEPACEDCRQFCGEAGAILATLDVLYKPAPETSEDYWTTFSSQLRTNLIAENSAKRFRAFRARGMAALAVAASVVVAVTWGTLHVPNPVVQGTEVRYMDDHIKGLDAQVVDYLGRSELFLRSFTKIEPSRIEDIEDARARASRNLAGIASQKTAAGDFAPVRIALDEYESVLRDIKNMDSSEDIADIKMRIQRNGLIANFKAYQPRVVLVSQQ